MSITQAFFEGMGIAYPNSISKTEIIKEMEQIKAIMKAGGGLTNIETTFNDLNTMRDTLLKHQRNGTAREKEFNKVVKELDYPDISSLIVNWFFNIYYLIQQGRIHEDDKNGIATIFETRLTHDQLVQVSKKVVKQMYQETLICGVCAKPSKNKCAKCLKIYYCSAECQRCDWKEHKKTCNKV